MASDLQVFSTQTLDEATNSYARENSLGRGGFGTGYKGSLGGRLVVVMKLNPDSSRGAEERFEKEIAALAKANHRLVVPLIGYNSSERCIVYEGLAGGNLEERLTTGEGRKSLAGNVRLRIAYEVAQALSFLHSLTPQLLHQDVKPGNVMIKKALGGGGGGEGGGEEEEEDGGGVCKLGGTGLAKFLPATDSSVWGTAGYIDPMLLRTGKYGPQSDLYGFGLVLLQLLTGERVTKVVDYAR